MQSLTVDLKVGLRVEARPERVWASLTREIGHAPEEMTRRPSPGGAASLKG
ncbi:MAG: hypothetical protein DHS20C14_00520 [Phycisphaeraceae bacterium]|nr:MAG: hypothetical protein DHS20C14_00520 [Phycisphaeraceae bacterium]